MTNTALLREAREFIAEQRAVIFDSQVLRGDDNPLAGTLDEDGQAEVAPFDAILAKLDAALDWPASDADGWQPIVIAADGIVRFKANPIVKYLLDNGRVDLNQIAAIAQSTGRFTDEDQALFAQLIGYSVSGWGSLSYVTPDDTEKADRISERVIAEAKRPPPPGEEPAR